MNHVTASSIPTENNYIYSKNITNVYDVPISALT